ncbi:glutamine synthetase III family protein [Prevotella nigrescens]|jgi:glutamate--ammonia ligase, catalytic domain protein|uniref:glutamine synthetase III family protein n=1 Tax=Prevotella nigrescens TaxID=28133 RepID=UPI0002182F14|nr:glutamine synthetase III [Prevotella nigrescens]EGQ12662.1 glutamine synthetase [Prevotella nigrescens ATCC 33563]MBF1445019.1 glutamine synthetase III [Prevotella nigrescens]UAK28795.1 glutamine synthetase III [Prevotella nigrescens]WMS22083.1 glutamine synthetase III [Prevotella nigrescens]SUB93533.1 Glutamine synthetase [Prevotella nigrescens]
MDNLRFEVVKEAFRKRPVELEIPKEQRPSGLFGKYVFNREKMFKYLPIDIFNKMMDVMENGERLDRSIADGVANGMKKWAEDNGVTHYTHWFQPLTEGTAEKHDSFIEPDGKGGMIEEFSGKLLVQQEPDASSFPSGGIRNTFEARGYSAWDPTSPVFIIDDTLCIPTIFISYTGESLDYKAPLLRSLRAVDNAAKEVCQYFYSDVKKVHTNLGWEQEYFLVDEDLYFARPDLMLTGRTLMGHDSAKNQQMEDHYFGTIPERVQAFMKELEIRALELGIPVKTRHNEVAPGQFELAPIFEECNLAVDHNMLLMAVMKKVAHRHGFRVLLHEKPFAGINGSGKHNNWSLSTDTGILLHKNGKNANDNLRFVVFVVETLMGVYKHNGVLKASVMSATNDHRLGANEAPPAIISSFLGKQISDLLEHIEKADKKNLFSMKGKQGMQLDIPEIPELLIDNTDRNRTSPFAFTGNRFELRAVGSEANCASALIVLNTAVAEALTNFKQRVDALISRGEDQTSAIIEVVREDIKICKPIHFDGNGYSEEWKEEAAKRGLDCEASCPVCFDAYLHDDSVRMFEQMNVMTRSELEARNEVKWETYTKKIQIEARVMGDLAMNHIIPVVTHYQSRLAKNVSSMINIFGKEEGERITKRNIKILKEIAERIQTIETGVDELIEARKVANKIDSQREKAIAYHDDIVPQMEEIRYQIDKLELIVSDEMWTLPKYRELLFIR